ncbi:glycosyltransferase [Photobacterium leiognathi]|uniref:glycosyltransferase n=1 Tax=Photobacterium leiognathi TaxID=553611 RepID=UPI002982860D|nr:glycosyltransferase [Photobacterium leiognathi]
MNRYIVLVSNDIGGAEKRFYDIFRRLRMNNKNYYLVLPSCLLKKLGAGLHDEGIIALNVPKWSFGVFIKEYYFNVIRKANCNDSFHYPLNPLFVFHLGKLRNFSISYCFCYEQPKLSSKSFGLKLQKIASFFTKKIDVLNNDVFKFVNVNTKFSLTPGGTFVNNSVTDDVFLDKKNKIVFLSRLEKGKGVDTFLKLVPCVYNMLKDVGICDIEFVVYGKGSLEQFVTNEVDKLVSDGFPIKFDGFQKAEIALKNTKLVFSLQDKTNYPSRVVAESLLYGCRVIVLNSGDSHLFGAMNGLSYLNDDYSNLNECLVDFIFSESLDIKDQIKDFQNISSSAKEKFSSENYINYYKDIFENYE